MQTPVMLNPTDPQMPNPTKNKIILFNFLLNLILNKLHINSLRIDLHKVCNNRFLDTI